jgi:hypothetical protein
VHPCISASVHPCIRLFIFGASVYSLFIFAHPCIRASVHQCIRCSFLLVFVHPCIRVHSFVHFLCIRAFVCSFLCTRSSVHPCIRLVIFVHSCIRAFDVHICALVHPCIRAFVVHVVHFGAFVHSCILAFCFVLFCLVLFFQTRWLYRHGFFFFFLARALFFSPTTFRPFFLTNFRPFSNHFWPFFNQFPAIFNQFPAIFRPFSPPIRRYSYWDGSGNRKTAVVKKGDSVGEFLRICLKDLSKEVRDLRCLACGNMELWRFSLHPVAVFFCFFCLLFCWFFLFF